MKVLFRADASVEIGSGHVIRCATLAHQLRAQGAEVTFGCRHLPGDLNDWLAGQGYPVIVWASDHPADASPVLESYLRQQAPDWLVVDHYGLDAEWEIAQRPWVRSVLVIDDLANRPHQCDVLLDQNYFAEPQGRYQRWVPDACQLLLGPTYALLRPEFQVARQSVLVSGKRKQPKLERLQICFGGSDPAGETLRALQALELMEPKRLSSLWVDVIVGASNPQQDMLREACQARPGFQFYCQTRQMGELMMVADLAIGAGGTTTWERLCVGLPAIVISVAENQEQISREVATVGAQLYLGRSGEVSVAQLAATLSTLLDQPEPLQAYAEQAFLLVDGEGVNRVAERLWAG